MTLTIKTKADGIRLIPNITFMSIAGDYLYFEAPSVVNTDRINLKFITNIEVDTTLDDIAKKLIAI